MGKKQFCFMLIAILIGSLALSNANGASEAKMQGYKSASFSSAEVIADILNVRVGPGLDYNIVCKAKKGEIFRVYAQINDWYLIQNQQNYFGLVKGEYIKKYVPKASKQNNSSGNILTNQEKQLLTLINNQRKKAKLKALKIDYNLVKVARLKAKDMVNENYFSNKSPNYGSPFEMMDKFKIAYKTAGENIAGSTNVTQTFKAWMKTESHKRNILNRNFNYTGIGISNSKEYGIIIAQEFVGR